MTVYYKKAIFFLLVALFLYACNSKNSYIHETHFTGFTQGTTYSIRIVGENISISKEDIEKTLAYFDTIFSSYIQESHISQINLADSFYVFEDKQHFFQRCYNISQQMYSLSEGLFDPSVSPLVEAWGFFDKQENIPKQQIVDSLLTLVNFERGKLHEISFKNDSVYFQKKKRGFKLDFNAIAQGFSVDIISNLLEEKDCNNYFVEIGGEIRVKGKNKNQQKWIIGIEPPDPSNKKDETITTLLLTDSGIATSGNYRNFFEKNGEKYAHILNPKLGRPTKTDILSATVIAPNATLADAYATVFILWGKKKSVQFLKQNSELEAIIIYLDEKGRQKIYNSLEK